MRFAPLMLAAALALHGPALAQGTGAEPFPDEAREALRAEIRAYLLENPEVIMEAIQILEERRNAEAAASDATVIAEHEAALFEDASDYVAGNPEGDITLVKFSDYRCGYCKRAHPIVEELVETDPNLKLVIKEFPILGPQSMTAGRMAIAAHALDPGKFGALNDALMAHEGDLSEAAAYRLANEAGYDIPALKEAAASETVDAKLRETYELAQALGLQGTPSFVVGDEVIRGFLPIDEMRAAIAAARRASN